MSDDTDIRVRYDHRLAAIKVEVDFNWSELGEQFMRASNEEQAHFLLGWDRAADRMGLLPMARQYRYISEALPHEQVRRAVSQRIYELAEYIDPEYIDPEEPAP